MLSCRVNFKKNEGFTPSMGREMSECETFIDSEEEMPEPETEDFFNEVVQNSLRTKGKGYNRMKLTKKNKSR